MGKDKDDGKKYNNKTYKFHLTNEIIDGFFGKENRLKMR